ncbi:MAG TPA: hemerythrin domain-containing protein [Polyangiaceae bacterium]|nr:hemerythrin domain-containing protein [Polyangiaceae bacterium]
MANTIEQLGVGALGTLKAVKAGLNGLRGVFLHLAEEHGELAALMKELSKSRDAQVRREHYPEIRAKLLAHEHAELSEVYSVLDSEDTREWVALHHQEAANLETALRALDALNPESDAWGLAFDRLFTLVAQHVDQEEQELFPKAQAALGEEAAQALLTRYEAAKGAAKRPLQ